MVFLFTDRPEHEDICALPFVPARWLEAGRKRLNYGILSAIITRRQTDGIEMRGKLMLTKYSYVMLFNSTGSISRSLNVLAVESIF